MTPENQKKYNEKVKRIKDAIALKEPDRVPITPSPLLFPIFNAGYTVAEVAYDTSLEKARRAAIKYLTDFDPDMGTTVGTNAAGEGPALEIIKPKNRAWPGMPNNSIDENSLIQHIEYPLLHDDEFEEFFSDRSGWMLRKSLPRTAELLEPLANFAVGDLSGGGTRELAHIFSAPEFKSMIKDFWAIDEFYKSYQEKVAALAREVEELGYPLLNSNVKRGGQLPFDTYSDFYRGTMLSMQDLYDRPEDIERYIDSRIEEVVENTLATKGIDEGKLVFMALHKGMDGFMSGEMYRKYYWKHLKRMLLAIVECGRIPYVFTEGKYDSRIDFLTEVPPGKIFYHFEDVDMAVAKKKLGGIACISGGFPAALLDWGTPEMVRDEVKRLIDTCAPGGGFIFETSCGLGRCKRENVEAMFETAREYGVYR